MFSDLVLREADWEMCLLGSLSSGDVELQYVTWSQHQVSGAEPRTPEIMGNVVQDLDFPG